MAKRRTDALDQVRRRVPAEVIRVVEGREEYDCAIASIAMYVGETYENVLRAAVIVERKYFARFGLWVHNIQTLCRGFGVPVRLKRRVDVEDDYGLVLWPEHLNVLRNGLIIEPNGTIWEFDAYAAAKGVQPEGILIHDTRQQRPGHRHACARVSRTSSA